MLDNFLKQHQKPFTLEKRIQLQRIKMKNERFIHIGLTVQILSDSLKFDRYPNKFLDIQCKRNPYKS